MLYYAKSLQSCPTLCNPIDSSSPGSSVPGILQARILEWVPRARHLECKVKWVLGSVTKYKASGGDEIPGKLFQILKDDTVEVLQWICQQIWNIQQWPQDWKRSVLIPVSKKGNAKECSNCHTIALISHTSNLFICLIDSSSVVSNPSFFHSYCHHLALGLLLSKGLLLNAQRT